MAASDERDFTMAAEAAAEIVSQKLDILPSRPEWVGCLANDALRKARANLYTIQKYFSAGGRPSPSTEWTMQLSEALYNAEEFIDKFYFRVAHGRHEALHVATRPLAVLVYKYMLWRDLSNLVKSMKVFCKNQYLITEPDGGIKDGPASFVPWEGRKLARLTNFWDQRASTDFVCCDVCHGTEKREITELIQKSSTDVHGTSIFGEQGTGKTFLARRVYWEAMNLGFDSHAWVHVPACTDKREFLFEILKQLDKLARDSMDCNEIKKMLRWKLAKSKRFLIVLDDVQLPDQQLLQELLKIIPFPWPGHIITTTQNYTIARIMNAAERDPIKLKDLGRKESEKMLAKKLRGVRDDSRLDNEEGKSLDRCPAVPLCVSLLGGLLSYAKQERPALPNGDAKLSVPEVIQLSYHRLPVHLKPCFIYMVLFPVASPISTRRLVRLWLAEGLLDSHCCNRELKRTPEDLGETFILELADRKVIEVVSWRADGSPKACQMLTSLYYSIRRNTMRTGFLYVHKASKLRGGNDSNPTGQQQQQLDAPRGETKVRWLAEHTNIVRDSVGHSYRDLNLGHIRSFLSFYPRKGMLTEDISTFLRNTTSKANYSLLRVLDLEGVYKPSLQGVLGKLVLLRYLGLRSTVSESIPSEVAHLHYLETLDMKDTNISSLPSPLWKNRNLRHLHLNWFYIDLMEILKACSNNAMALTQLQTLNGLIIGEVPENLVRDHKHSLTTLTTLTTLKLYLQRLGGDSPGAAGKTVADWISFGLTNLQSLTFGVIQEANPVEETPPTKESPKEAQSPKGATTVENKPAEEAQPRKGKKPATSKFGPLPGLSLAQHHELLELYLLGQLTEPVIWTQLLPCSLRVLTLSGSMVETDMMTQLGDLLKHLRTFRLLANSFRGSHLRFAKDGFPSLLFLKIWKLPSLQEMTIAPGAMPQLKELDFRHLDAMKKVEGIGDQCKELKIIRVVFKKGAHDLVKNLEEAKGSYKIEKIETDDDNDSQ